MPGNKLKKPKKIRVKLRGHDAIDVSQAAQSVADNLIAHHGSKLAFVIGRLVHEKVYTNYKRLKKKYGEVT